MKNNFKKERLLFPMDHYTFRQLEVRDTRGIRNEKWDAYDKVKPDNERNGFLNGGWVLRHSFAWRAGLTLMIIIVFFVIFMTFAALICRGLGLNCK